MAKGNVSISVEEYKELLLREKPTDKDRELLKRIFDIIEPKLEYSTYNYGYVMDHVKVDDQNEIFKEIFTMLKYVDFDKYMEIWNKVMSNERKRKDQEELLKQMKDAKALRADNKEEE